jgi:MaoC like domain.
VEFTEKNIKLGKSIDEVEEGEKFSLTECISDREILLYLGLTTDNNPLYLQYDYVKGIGLKKPLLPSTLIYGIIASTISKHLPGPGSNIVNVTLNILENMYRGDTLKFDFKVIKVDRNKELITIAVKVKRGKTRVADSIVLVSPPKTLSKEKDSKDKN